MVALVRPAGDVGRGEEAEGGTGHVDAGRVDTHAKRLVETVPLVETPATRGFICLFQANCPSGAGGWKGLSVADHARGAADREERRPGGHIKDTHHNAQ